MFRFDFELILKPKLIVDAIDEQFDSFVGEPCYLTAWLILMTDKFSHPAINLIASI